MIGMEKYPKRPSFSSLPFKRIMHVLLKENWPQFWHPSPLTHFPHSFGKGYLHPRSLACKNPFILQFLDILFPLTLSASSSSSSSPVLIFRSGSSFGTLPDRSVSVALFPATSVIPPSLLWFMTSPVSQGRSPYCRGVEPMRIEPIVACSLSLTVSLMLFLHAHAEIQNYPVL